MYSLAFHVSVKFLSGYRVERRTAKGKDGSETSQPRLLLRPGVGRPWRRRKSKDVSGERTQTSNPCQGISPSGLGLDGFQLQRVRLLSGSHSHVMVLGENEENEENE